MKHLLTAIACFFALSMSAQTPYNPDVDGDGCITVTDVLGVLSQFEICANGVSLYYFTVDKNTAPYAMNTELSASSDEVWYVNSDNDWLPANTPEQFNEAMVWMLQHQGEEVSGFYSNEEISIPVQPIDSITNVSVPLSNSIPNGSIEFSAFENSGLPKFLIPTSLYTTEFLGANNIFYEVSDPCQPANTDWSSYWYAGTFAWQDESYVNYDLCVGEYCSPWAYGVFNVYDGY